MTAAQSLVDELEAAIASSDIGRRAVILRRVADLFVSTAGNLSNEQTALFDDVMRQLLDEIETGARARFAEYLAERPAAPPGILRELALDDAIDVAAPILSHAELLDETTLVEGASSKSQAHLLAISTRKRIPESVTDILLERGDREVALSTAGNPGASFSEFGFSTFPSKRLSISPPYPAPQLLCGLLPGDPILPSILYLPRRPGASRVPPSITISAPVV